MVRNPNVTLTLTEREERVAKWDKQIWKARTVK